jgi:DNA-binding transcriptional LysR family regulator
MKNFGSRKLGYFIAVAETGHIGRAAERLRISQPPLTRQIQALEAELGVDLFHRTARGVTLTQAGEQLLADARNISVLMDQAAERAQRAGRGQVGRLDVGLYGSASFDIVPRMLSEFGGRHPDVKVVLHYAQAPQQVEALRQGRVQIVFERMLPDEADIVTELVAREPVILALPADHPLARERVVAVAKLRNAPMIVQRSASSALSTVADNLCRAHGFEPRAVQDAGDVVTATITAASNRAVCLVPASMRNVRIPGIVYRPLRAETDAYMELHCFYLRDNTTPLLQVFLASIRRHRHADAPGIGDS